MSEDTNAFNRLPGFKEMLARISQVPASDAGEHEQFDVVQRVRDESNGIVYKLMSDHRLTPAEVRKALANAFRKTDIWPDDESEIEIRV
ncbi:hypothetical protein OJ996_09200 [Luteolibacter sp. GHJ8]|uniref:Uncharacterized protein n=1 Tax=Luteolibacter rhizosphaerae TaxID=2989719 RepID=A0ABT3G1N1_9BACT|nr:hypothetical protein [Luteolibacter rhizosphaerae]MCW1913750.1 hypothetical protein [Luteolibacter rhizosphaerae]